MMTMIIPKATKTWHFSAKKERWLEARASEIEVLQRRGRESFEIFVCKRLCEISDLANKNINFINQILI